MKEQLNNIVQELRIQNKLKAFEIEVNNDRYKDEYLQKQLKEILEEQ